MTEPARPTQQEYWNSRVGEEWANRADHMDRMLASMTEAGFGALALQPGERVLDIGCGAGVTTLNAARQVGGAGLAIGVDLSRPLLDVARKRAAESGANAQFVEGDVSAVELPGAPFDAAFSRFGVMFFDDPPAAFAKLRWRLRDGGRFVFICWRPFAENVWTFEPLAAIKPLLAAPVAPADPNAPGPFALSDAGRIKAILDASGWSGIQITPWDGDVRLGADAREAAQFLLKIGPCARAVADQQLDGVKVENLLTDFLSKYAAPAGVSLAAACWIVRAVA